MSGRKKYSNEFKFQIVQEYLEGKNGGFETLQAKYGVAYSQIRSWVYLYKTGGIEYLTKVRRTYSGDFKVHVVEYMHEHRFSHKKTSIIFMISDCLVKEWDLVYRHEGKDVLLKGNYMKSKKKKNIDLNRKSREELLEEIEQLRMENAYLKKLRALIQKGTKPNNGKK